MVTSRGFSKHILILLIGLGLVLPGNAEATHRAPQWSKPKPVAGVRSLFSVSCPTRHFCMAVGGKQAVAYHSGHWSAPLSIDSHSGINAGLVTVSCASPSSCVAGDGTGDDFVYNGTSWSAATLVTTAGFAQISCPATTFCGGVDARGTFWQFNGSTWSRPSDQPEPVMFISCPSAGSCTAEDGTGSDMWRLQNGSWSRAGYINPTTPYGGSMDNVGSGISCSDPTFCVALDDFGEAFVGRNNRWSGPKSFDSHLLTQNDAVSCPTENACVVVDANGLTARWNGSKWSRSRKIDDGNADLFDVSCPTAQFCTAVDFRGRALIYG